MTKIPASDILDDYDFHTLETWFLGSSVPSKQMCADLKSINDRLSKEFSWKIPSVHRGINLRKAHVGIRSALTLLTGGTIRRLANKCESWSTDIKTAIYISRDKSSPVAASRKNLSWILNVQPRMVSLVLTYNPQPKDVLLYVPLLFMLDWSGEWIQKRIYSEENSYDEKEMILSSVDVTGKLVSMISINLMELYWSIYHNDIKGETADKLFSAIGLPSTSEFYKEYEYWLKNWKLTYLWVDVKVNRGRVLSTKLYEK